MNNVSVNPGRSSVTTEKSLRNMAKNYLDLMAECAVSDEALDKFKGNMHSVLNDRGGMKIPKDVSIVLDTKFNRWATVYITTKDGKVAISEQHLTVNVNENMLLNEESASVTVKPFSEVTISVHDELKRDGVRAVLELPFFDVHGDTMTDIKFSDNEEIVLTSC